MADLSTSNGGRKPRKTAEKKAPSAPATTPAGTARREAAKKTPAAGRRSAATAVARSTSATGPVKASPRKPASAIQEIAPPAIQQDAPPAARQVAPPAAGQAAPAAPAAAPADPWWTGALSDPDQAAAHLAHEAVRRHGPAARDWLAQAQRRYPDASAHGLARLAARELARTGLRRGAGTGAPGPAGSLAAATVLANTHARAILTIAATYGADPTSEERVPELLELLRIPRLNPPNFAAARSAGRMLGALALRYAAARALPLGALIAGAVQGRRSTEDVAVRAIAYYRGIRGR